MDVLDKNGLSQVWGKIKSDFAPKSHTHTKSQITDFPTKLSQFTNDAGYLTSIPSEYVTDSELSAKGYVTKTTADRTYQPKGSYASSSHTHPAATTSADGFMSDTDKTKLNGIETGAQVNKVYSVAGRTGAITLSKTDVGLSNVTNESKATMFTSPAFTGVPTAPTAGISTNNTQVATTAFVQNVVDSKISASDAMIYKGTIGTGGTVTALPTTHKTGWTYKVITSGTYAGQKCEIGDMIIALIDRSGTNNSNSDWSVIQTNLDGAVSGPTSAVSGRVAVFNGATGKLIKDSGFTIAKSVPSDAKFTDTTYGTATSSAAGLIKIGYAVSGKNYPVQLNTGGQAFVNVPWTDTNTDTLNTAGSSNSSSKLFIVGAPSQAASSTTYSHDTAYIGTDGCLYSNSTKVSVEGHTHSQYLTAVSLATISDLNPGWDALLKAAPNVATANHTHSNYLTKTTADGYYAAKSHTHNGIGMDFNSLQISQTVLDSAGLVPYNVATETSLSKYPSSVGHGVRIQRIGKGNSTYIQAMLDIYHDVTNNEVYLRNSVGGKGTTPVEWGSWNKIITSGNLYEANLKWGGRNFSASYGCIDAAMISELGANRFAFLKPDGITIEYTRDGSSWTDYGASTAEKLGLFSSGAYLVVGKSTTSNIPTATCKLRVTIDTSKAGIYTQLNKMCIYCSTNGSSGSNVTIEKALQSTPTSFVTVASNVPLSGWSGYNIINFTPFVTYGNSSSIQYGKIRLTFGITGHSSSSYGGLAILKIMAFGGVGWTTPSNLAKHGHIYNYDYAQNAYFPNSIISQTIKTSQINIECSDDGTAIGYEGEINRKSQETLYIQHRGGNVKICGTGGNVGIGLGGSAVPSERLHVKGNIKATSFIEGDTSLSDKYAAKSHTHSAVFGDLTTLQNSQTVLSTRGLVPFVAASGVNYPNETGYGIRVQRANKGDASYTQAMFDIFHNLVDNTIYIRASEGGTGSTAVTYGNWEKLVTSASISSYLTGYATKSHTHTKSQITDFPTKVSAFTNDAGYLTAVPSEYVTDSELSAKGYVTKTTADSTYAAKSHTHSSYLTKTTADGYYQPKGSYAASSHTHTAATTSAAGFMSAADKTKLNGIATGANKYVHPSTHDADMINGLTASRVAISSSAGVLTSSTITTTELGYLDGVTSNIQTQLSGKAASNHTHSQYLTAVPSEYVTDSELSAKGYITKTTADSTYQPKGSYAASNHTHSYLSKVTLSGTNLVIS